MSKIKTRDIVRDVKTLDRAANLSQRIKDTATKSKSTLEQQEPERQRSNPSEYATDTACAQGKSVAYQAQKTLRHPIRKTQRARQSSQEVQRAAENVRQAFRELRNGGNAANAHQAASTTRTGQGAQGANAPPSANTARPVNAASPTNAARPANAARGVMPTKGTTPSKTARVPSVRKKELLVRPLKKPASSQLPVGKKLVRTADKTVKTATKGTKTIKTAGVVKTKTAAVTGKAIKTSAGTAKVATKSSVLAAKATTKTTVAGVQIAKLAFIKAKAAAVKAKLVIKAIIALVKLAIAALKSVIAFIAVGGWIAVLVIVLIGVFAAFIASPLGIFFAGEDSGEDGQTMQEVVADLTAEFYAGVDEITTRIPHDVLRIGGMTIRWNEVLAIYAVRIATDDEHGMDVVTLDDERVALIRQTLDDMVRLVYSVHTEYEEYTTEDDEGYEIIEIIVTRILTITLDHRSALEMADYYGFNADQREVLEELLSPELLELWVLLLGGSAVGDGRVLTGNENFIPLGMFAWPLEGNWPITSRFGPRPSPGGIGSTNHGGIDIGAPTGTPILASAAGEVVQSGWNGGFGNYIRIYHGGGYHTAYAHNSRNTVVRGQMVVQGQVIGYVGSTGNSTGCHLHFEIIRNGVRVDPLGYFTW